MEFIDNIDNFSDKSGLVLTIGFFDGVHAGHKFLIEQLNTIAEEEGLKSAIFTFWPHPRIVLNENYKPKLLSSFAEKFALIEKLTIDYCIRATFSEELSNLQALDFMRLLKEKLNVKHLLIGYDHRFGKNREEGFDDYCKYGTELGIKVSRANPYIEDGKSISSSFIRDLLNVGEVSLANKYLTHTYELTGTVVKGNQNGRTIGFPTVNLNLDCQNKCLPKKGVYAASTAIENIEKRCMLYIGNRPSLGENQEISIEAHILDFSGDLYGKTLKVFIHERIRGQEKFNSLNELRVQLEKDKIRIKELAL